MKTSKRLSILLFFWLVASVPGARAQDYHAIQGSNYAGGLGIHNNPASIVNAPFPWDITLVGVQSKYGTDAVKVYDYSLLSSVMDSRFRITSGYDERFANQQTNINLLNSRIALGQKKAIAFGANFRTFGNAYTSRYNYVDSLQNFNGFLSVNEESEPFDVKLRGSSVVELYATYAQTVLDHTDKRLNAGLTLRVNRGVAGGRADINQVSHQRNDGGGYSVAGGDFLYGYSSNLDDYAENGSKSTGVADRVRKGLTGFSFDAGLEFLLNPGGAGGYQESEEEYYDYDWKIGLSLLDAGWAHYDYGSQSRQGVMPQSGVTGELLDAKLNAPFRSLAQLNDSISGFVPLEELSGDFYVFHPGRLVVNADRYLFRDFYINGELSLNLGGILGKERLTLRNMNLLRVTPRWETSKWGVYLPLLLNKDRQFWVGAGFRAGPLLLGFHNLGNLISRNKMANGGGYLALTLRPWRKVTGSGSRDFLKCPPLP